MVKGKERVDNVTKKFNNERSIFKEEKMNMFNIVNATI